MIEREELVNDLANVLAEHRLNTRSRPACSCGWTPPSWQSDTWGWRMVNIAEHRVHVAEQLAQCIERVVL